MTQSKKQVLSFDEWFVKNFDYLCTTKDSASEAWEAGCKSQQNEVDKLQTEIDELQKRIDEVLEYIGNDFDDYYTGVMVESIHYVLKGKQND